MVGVAYGRNSRWAVATVMSVAAVFTAAVYAPVAVANHTPTWQAKWAGQAQASAGLLESGESDSAFIDAQNVGTITWQSAAHGLHLGTDTPHDRSSPFFREGWLNFNRPAALAPASVAPGGIGRFSFSVRAPRVTSEQTLQEHFAPVADLAGEWLDGPSWGNTAGDGVFLRWTVRPPEFPVVRLTSVPNLVDPGAPVRLRARASDNVRVTKVIFSIADRPPVVDTTAPYEAELSTVGVASGIRLVKAVAVDGVAQEELDQAFVEIGEPVLGESTNAEPVSGRVLVALPPRAAAARRGRGSQKGLRFRRLTEPRRIPIGSFLDTKRGRVRLEMAAARRGERQTGEFVGGGFQVLQSRKRSAKGLTELRLKGASFRRCVQSKDASAAKSRGSRTIRRLRGNAKGRFRTRGRFSAATVRGTTWSVADRCDGTLTTVTRGRVAVRDFRRRKNVLLRAGKSYLAPARR